MWRRGGFPIKSYWCLSFCACGEKPFWSHGSREIFHWRFLWTQGEYFKTSHDLEIFQFYVHLGKSLKAEKSVCKILPPKMVFKSFNGDENLRQMNEWEINKSDNIVSSEWKWTCKSFCQYSYSVREKIWDLSICFNYFRFLLYL